jgi:uncharacterized protein (TIGR03083 family)
MTGMPPIHTVALFPALYAELIALLRGLSEGDWMRQTLAPAWRVRDVVGHLLDVDLRGLAGRDSHVPPTGRPSAATFAAVLRIINEANASGVAYSQRLSPRVMTDLLAVTAQWVSTFVASLPAHETAAVSVLWADEDRSENWMHIGREYTERWHHQMQIRDAVGAEHLLQRQWFHPVLDLSVRAFRRAYKNVEAPPGTTVVFEVDAEPDYQWSVVREASAWVVVRGRASGAAASVRMDAATAWKLLFNALHKDDAESRMAISGESRLIEPVVGTRAVMV